MHVAVTDFTLCYYGSTFECYYSGPRQKLLFTLSCCEIACSIVQFYTKKKMCNYVFHSFIHLFGLSSTCRKMRNNLIEQYSKSCTLASWPCGISRTAHWIRNDKNYWMLWIRRLTECRDLHRKALISCIDSIIVCEIKWSALGHKSSEVKMRSAPLLAGLWISAELECFSPGVMWDMWRLIPTWHSEMQGITNMLTMAFLLRLYLLKT